MNDRRGVWAAAAAYSLWGVLPIYWKLVQAAPALEILGHRVVWSAVFLLGLLLASRQGGQWLGAWHRPKILLTYAFSAALLSINWLTYIWSVNAGYIVDSSLGYFITPLLSVLLGVIFLKERLRRRQLVAVALAALGVLYLALNYGVILWIPLTLAASFGLYGLLRKLAPLDALAALALETSLLFLPAAIYLGLRQAQGQAAFGADWRLSGLLILAGIVTGLPLLLFGYGARRISLINLGILQYIAPTLQFLIGVLIYGEAFTPTRLIGFALIWGAIIIYWGDGWRQARRPAVAQATGLPG